MTDSKNPGAPREPEDDLDRARHLAADLGAVGMVGGSAGSSGEIALLYEIARDIVSTLDYDTLLPRILEAAIAHTGAERGILFHIEPGSGSMRPLLIRGVDPESLEGIAGYSRTIVNKALHREVVHTDDASVDAEFRQAESVRLHAIRAAICVPIVNGNRVLGALYLDRLVSGRPLPARAEQFAGILAGLSGAALENAERYRRLTHRNEHLSRELARHSGFEELIGRSGPMLALLDDLERIASTAYPVLILGESGTGKELLARAVHRCSPRSDGPLVAQNCAAIPAELLESEFFGHERGAFTGAMAARPGLFRQADGGTLFLDEIADLGLPLQAKLLRVLEDGRVRPIGSQAEWQVDFRLIGATSTDLATALEEGRLRRDLYYRLNVVTLRVPPLRERSEDIPLLLEHFLEKHRPQAGGARIRFSQRAQRRLQARSWIGNVRELEHFVKRVLVLSKKELVDEDDLARFLDDAGQRGVIELPVGEITLREMEERAVLEAMRRAGGNQVRAAEILGIHRNALIRRLKRIEEQAE